MLFIQSIVSIKFFRACEIAEIKSRSSYSWSTKAVSLKHDLKHSMRSWWMDVELCLSCHSIWFTSSQKYKTVLNWSRLILSQPFNKNTFVCILSNLQGVEIFILKKIIKLFVINLQKAAKYCCFISLHLFNLLNLGKQSSETLGYDTWFWSASSLNQKLSHLSIFLAVCSVCFIPVWSKHCKCFSTSCLPISKYCAVISVCYLLNIFFYKVKNFTLRDIFFEYLVIRRSHDLVIMNYADLLFEKILLYPQLRFMLFPVIPLSIISALFSH